VKYAAKIVIVARGHVGDHRKDSVGDVQSTGRAALLIGDDSNLVALTGEA
jgi:hypothetical protein